MEENSNVGNVVSIADAPRPQKAPPSQETKQRQPKTAEIVRQFLDLLKHQCDPETFFHAPDGELFAHIRVERPLRKLALGLDGFPYMAFHAYFRLMGTCQTTSP